MNAKPTCGQGLAEHSVVPAKLSALVSAMADNLESHVRALDLNDQSSREEFEVYVIAQQNREIEARLRETAALMAGQRALPIGRHVPAAIADPSVIAAFQKLVRVETELVELMQRVLETHWNGANSPLKAEPGDWCQSDHASGSKLTANQATVRFLETRPPPREVNRPR